MSKLTKLLTVRPDASFSSDSPVKTQHSKKQSGFHRRRRMSKLTKLLMVALLLFFTLTHAARPDAYFSSDSPVKTQNSDVQAENVEGGDENCGGVGKEECLIRRTLAAQIDYVYTPTKPEYPTKP